MPSRRFLSTLLHANRSPVTWLQPFGCGVCVWVGVQRLRRWQRQRQQDECIKEACWRVLEKVDNRLSRAVQRGAVQGAAHTAPCAPPGAWCQTAQRRAHGGCRTPRSHHLAAACPAASAPAPGSCRREGRQGRRRQALPAPFLWMRRRREHVGGEGRGAVPVIHSPPNRHSAVDASDEGCVLVLAGCVGRGPRAAQARSPEPPPVPHTCCCLISHFSPSASGFDAQLPILLRRTGNQVGVRSGIPLRAQTFRSI